MSCLRALKFQEVLEEEEEKNFFFQKSTKKYEMKKKKITFLKISLRVSKMRRN